ncbi:acetyl-CoA carboxylase biotin carboxyl carrier protein [bacterium]|nr:acetyl-CoA carboxylase biotin carboxyl carrier protein [bacterium]
MRKIKITDTTIRDIFQNLSPGNINIKNFDEILKLIDEINFESLEVWGGASFERMLSNNFDKSPWEILSYIKSKVSGTPLQALLGARNLVNFDYYPKDIIKRFIRLSSKNGISIFRIYDALNDIENLKVTIDEVLKNGSKCQGTIIYDPDKKEEFYIDFITELRSLGCHSVCIKDAESTLIPQKSKELFMNLNKINEFDIYLNTKNLKGLQVSNYFEALTNGCSGIDLSFISSSYYDNNLPTVFPLILSLKDSEISHLLNKDRIDELYRLIKKDIYPNIHKNITFSSMLFSNLNKNLLPGWLILMLENQLSEIGAIDKFEIVFEEILRIKKEVGNPSMSTPIGQIIGGQAILNTLISDKRWEIISDEMQLLLKGSFGKLPDKIDDNILNVLKSYENIENISDLKNEDLYESCKSDLKKYSQDEEDILSYCFFPDRTIKFLKQKKKLRSNPIDGLKKEEIYELTQKESEKILKSINKNDFFIKENGRKSENEQPDKDDNMINISNLDVKKIKEIIELLENSNLDEIKIESGDIKLTLNKSGKIKTQNSADNFELSRLRDLEYSTEKPSGPISENLAEQPKTTEKNISAGPEDMSNNKNIIEVKSPIVGVFYNSPTPGEPPFVTIGKKVRKGDTLCIVEAMKLMNKINSDYDGIVEKILVTNEEPVEYDQAMMIIKTF